MQVIIPLRKAFYNYIFIEDCSSILRLKGFNEFHGEALRYSVYAVIKRWVANLDGLVLCVECIHRDDLV